MKIPIIFILRYKKFKRKISKLPRIKYHLILTYLITYKQTIQLYQLYSNHTTPTTSIKHNFQISKSSPILQSISSNFSFIVHPTQEDSIQQGRQCRPFPGVAAERFIIGLIKEICISYNSIRNQDSMEFLLGWGRGPFVPRNNGCWLTEVPR